MNRSPKVRAKMKMKALMQMFGVTECRGPYITEDGKALFYMTMKSGNTYTHKMEMEE